jgi:hypothetical protein
MNTDHKAQILAHCLRMSETDQEYAVWAAGWYEANEPALLKNLQAKVRQEIARKERADAGP